MEKQRAKTRLHVENYSVFLCLSRKFFEQLPSGSISLNLVVEFVDVVAHRHQEDLGQNLLVAAEQKLPETVILFDNAESALGLYGAVHP